jgi:RNA polymerase sigma-70 factor, ECF subfamily
VAVEAISGEILDAGFALAVQILRDRNDAADAVQDSVQHLLGRPSSYDPRRGSLRGWFLKVVRNSCVDRIRRSKRQATVSIDDNEPIARAEQQPDMVAEENELHQQLRHELRQLAEEHREVILLRDWHDLPYSEIATVLSIPAGTVMSRLSRAREELRKRMQRYR